MGIFLCPAATFHDMAVCQPRDAAVMAVSVLSYRLEQREVAHRFYCAQMFKKYDIMKKNESPAVAGDVEVFNFSGENYPVRFRLIDGEPWFLAKDVATVLGYTNPRKAISDHCKEKGVTFCYVLTNGDSEDEIYQ